MNVQEMKVRLLDLADQFKEKEEELTDLDRAIGDGDHGVNMLRGFEHLKDKIDDKDMKSLFKSTGMTLMSNIGGASGPLYGFGFIKMANEVQDEMDSENLKQVITAFAEGIQQRGKVKLNEKTMYDVIERTRQALENNENVDVEKLQSYANETKDMIATKGRASYFNEASKGYIDPGAQSSVYILNAIIGGESS